MKLIKKIAWKILYKIRLADIFQLKLASSLKDDGWFISFYKKESVDGLNNPIPWCTYSFIKFIEPRLTKKFNVFEYGAGNSTIWYAQRVEKIFSVEHDQSWASSIKKKLPLNATLILKNLSMDGDYAKSILESGEIYDLVIIDGRDRNNCIKYAVKKLADEGVIIFDNSQLDDYKDGLEYLRMCGFKELKFTGNLPIVPNNNTTSIFYKTSNCLKI